MPTSKRTIRNSSKNLLKRLLKKEPNFKKVINELKRKNSTASQEYFIDSYQLIYCPATDKKAASYYAIDLEEKKVGEGTRAVILKAYPVDEKKGTIDKNKFFAVKKQVCWEYRPSEWEIFSRYKHLENTAIVGQDVYIFIEFIPGMALPEYLALENPSLATRLNLICQIALQLHHFHNDTKAGSAFVHGDLSADNLLIKGEQVISGINTEVIDFGESAKVKEDSTAGDLTPASDINDFEKLIRVHILKDMIFPKAIIPNIEIDNIVDGFLAKMSSKQRPNTEEVLKFFNTLRLLVKAHELAPANLQDKHVLIAKLIVLQLGLWGKIKDDALEDPRLCKEIVAVYYAYPNADEAEKQSRIAEVILEKLPSSKSRNIAKAYKILKELQINISSLQISEEIASIIIQFEKLKLGKRYLLDLDFLKTLEKNSGLCKKILSYNLKAVASLLGRSDMSQKIFIQSLTIDEKLSLVEDLRQESHKKNSERIFNQLAYEKLLDNIFNAIAAELKENMEKKPADYQIPSFGLTRNYPNIKSRQNDKVINFLITLLKNVQQFPEAMRKKDHQNLVNAIKQNKFGKDVVMVFEHLEALHLRSLPTANALRK